MNVLLQTLPIAAPVAGWAAHSLFLARRLRVARTDPLTGLPSRDQFTAGALRAIRRPHAAVLLLDLNGFKQINDSHGHAAGDQLLAAVGQRLAAWCTTRDGFAGRLGGDEFAAVIRLAPDVDLHAELTYGLAADLAAPVRTETVLLSPRASIGICRTSDRPGAPLPVLLRGADEAMYQAKNARLPWQPATPTDIYRTTAGRRIGRPGTHLALSNTSRKEA
ncbi:GGDEF domain-containing protein [Streptomyces sp. 7N604]|uniref:GGDEF domain-containing protein n=1 Tax=Streptomyces sp. 7N604 TaxID=3457415 RepID=UPI003FD4BBB7